MEIASLNLHNQRNAGHYMFLTDFNDLVIRYSPQALGITEFYEVFKLLFQDEMEAFKFIAKSATTDELADADADRDLTLRSTYDYARAALNHYDANVRNAARVVNVIVERYGNLALLPYDEETASIDNLIKDLRTKAGDETFAMGLEPWLDMLSEKNTRFNDLEKRRNLEEANRTELRMKDVRAKIDPAYRKIVKRINALIEVNGEDNYSEFVKELNARIARARESIAKSKPHSVKAEEPDALPE